MTGEAPEDRDATVALDSVDGGARGSSPAATLSPDPAISQPVEDEPVARAEPAQVSVVRNSAIMAAGSLVSRFTGFARSAAIGAAIGAAAVGDNYNLAIAMPNMLYELLVGSVLSSVIVPVLVRRRKEDPDGGQAYTQRLLSLAVLALGAATTLAVLCAPLFTLAFRNKDMSGRDTALITHLSYLILPAIFFYGMAALCGALLNSRGHFAAPMWAPILNNIVVVGMAVTFITTTHGRQPTPENLTTTGLLILGLGTTLGIVVQASSLYPALRRVGFRWKWRFDFRTLGLGELGRLGAWMLIYVVVNQIGVVVVFNLAKRVAGHNSAGVMVYQNGFLIFMMAHGIVAVSVLTALLPRLSAAAAEGRRADLVAQMSSGIRLVCVVLVPITAAYLLLNRPIAVTLFQFGNYRHADALRTAPVIALAGLSLLPYAIMQLQQFAFYALRDTRSPALLNVPVVAVRIGIDLIFYLVLPATVVTASLMGGSALSFAFGAVLSFALLRRRIGLLDMRRVAVTVGKLIIAVAIAAVPTYLLEYGLRSVAGDGKIASLVTLAVCGVVLLAAYFGAALGLRVAEIRDLAGMVRRRIGR
jgi:putative peptidoglycan lipid II flippase